MNDEEFLYHMKIIRDFLKKPNIRIILLHNPYTESQQKIIDAICRNSKKILGQIERIPPTKEKAEEIKRLIESNNEPFISADKLQFVIIGQQKPH